MISAHIGAALAAYSSSMTAFFVSGFGFQAFDFALQVADLADKCGNFRFVLCRFDSGLFDGENCD